MMKNNSVNDIKHFGQVFTPDYLVSIILDVAEYSGTGVLKRHIMDNSCGDGSFLCVIAERYINAFLKKNPVDRSRLSDELSTYLHGIEKNEDSYSLCISNLNQTVAKYGLCGVHWDIIHDDALQIKKFDGKMDFVVGNPPYVRVHNLDDDYKTVKSFSFCQSGMTDLYLVFFELGFRMLAPCGRLCYITPSSWLNSVAGSGLREYILHSRTMRKLIDLEHYQPFRATTYTLISLFDNADHKDTFDYYRFNSEKLRTDFIETLSYNDAFINGFCYLATHDTLDKIRNIMQGYKRNLVRVKNGFATLSDTVFIRDSFPFSDYIIPVLKASTGKMSSIFYPYDKKGKPIERHSLFKNVYIQNYLDSHKKELLKEQNEEQFPQWYLYGRTQAIKDVWTKKYAINTVIKDLESIKFQCVSSGTGVYSGLYLLTELPETMIRKSIFSDDFMNYIKALKKYKSGGYYTFSSKELEDYLNYTLTDGVFSFD